MVNFMFNEMPQARLLALDWGTSSLRGALIAPDGQVLQILPLPYPLLEDI